LALMCICFFYVKCNLVMFQNVKKIETKNPHVDFHIVHAHKCRFMKTDDCLTYGKYIDAKVRLFPRFVFVFLSIL
jgi:hypothetical protein